ncbi:uncharacterized protein LOC119598589 [Penaeus monodon]|uniref:uncharacterized protein LOC119598589 n=1 Tax=Penaeus monodon TaxID=6687 RepID=UPI0018A73387|nr:uncharacterized protein LOC119598589 [Penaeus monodon]
MSDPNPSNPRAAPSDADPDSPRASRDRLSRRRMQRFFLIGDRDHSPPSCSDSDDDWYGEMLMMKMMRGDPCPRKGMWRPPRAVSPEPQEEEIVGADGLVDRGLVHSDARLFEAKEKMENGEIATRFVLQMPSFVPPELLGDSSAEAGPSAANSYNLLMADVSGSMTSYWPAVVSGWNTFVAPKLRGRTDLYVFGSYVELLRTGTELKRSDFTSGQTDLTGALQTIVDKVYTCKEKYVKVFIITDGDHNQSSDPPETVISLMREPKGKICDVYLLGAGKSFPVQYSVNIRSRLHNGSTNLPTLFWAEHSSDVENQMNAISKNLASMNERSLKLSVPGWKLPGTRSTQNFHILEWVFFPEDPEKHGSLKVSLNKYECQLALERPKITSDILSKVFRQWNSIAVQFHNVGKRVPSDLLPLMERLFYTNLQMGVEGHSVAARVARVNAKTVELEFRTNMNKVKEILTTEKHSDALRLAENILSTTVTAGKYEVRSLQLKGHSELDYEKDCQDFKKVYETIKAELMAMTVTPEECCRVTMSSTISDLQDEDFLQMLSLNKYEFLKQFTMSGIPVFSPTRDSVSLNPWSYNITRILRSPYTTLSQVALESYASNNEPGARHKDIKLKEDDDNTNFNAVIPVFSPEAAKLMEPLVQTRLYAMCVTFAILKNPHIIEYNIHIAALATCWVRILYEHPEVPRPEYVCLREESIIATASLYMKRKGNVDYCKLLTEDTPQALMTESTVKINKRPVKCESLIKPMFMLYFLKQREELEMAEVAKIVRLILVEFVGRNMSHIRNSKKNSTPYTDFFVAMLKDEDKKKEFLQSYAEKVKATIDKGESSAAFPLSKFYTLEEVQKDAKKKSVVQMRAVREKFALQVRVCMDKVERLFNVSLAGAVSWRTLRTYAREMGLPADVVEELFAEKSAFVYTQHALRYSSSKERLLAKIDSYEDAFSYVMRQVEMENVNNMVNTLLNDMVSSYESAWLTEYHQAHSDVVRPMSKEQILAEAAARGIEVTAATFDQVYRKYRPHLGLLSNACQCPSCPFFLQPNKRYNQHAIVERRKSTLFPHGFHQVAYDCREEGLKNAISEFQTGTHRKHKGQGKPLPKEAVAPLLQDMEQLTVTYSRAK